MKRLIFVSLALLASLLFSGTVQASNPPLYAGTSGDGRVYAYQGGTTWTPISDSLGYAVLDIAKFGGQLYAATMGADYVGRVWRYQGGTSWTVVGGNMDSQVADLEIYNGQLYAGTAWNGGKLYRYNGSNNFDYVGIVPSGTHAFSGIRAMYPSSYGYLQLGDIGYDTFGHFDGTTLHWDQFLGGSCIYDYAEYGGKLYAAAWQGVLYRSTNGINWSNVLGSHDGNMWELEPFLNQLYLSYDNGELAYLDALGNRHSVLTAPDGIISMVANGNSALYFGIGGEAGYNHASGTGYVYAYTGIGAPTLISGPMGDGVQCLFTPEPATICLLGLGALGLLRKHRA